MKIMLNFFLEKWIAQSTFYRLSQTSLSRKNIVSGSGKLFSYCISYWANEAMQEYSLLCLFSLVRFNHPIHPIRTYKWEFVKGIVYSAIYFFPRIFWNELLLDNRGSFTCHCSALPLRIFCRLKDGWDKRYLCKSAIHWCPTKGPFKNAR